MRRPAVVWGAALVAYVVAVLHRSSLGVAGVETVERFGVSATVLASFVVVQLTVYAALQIPAGVLLDRFGSRAMIATGAVLMAAGQLLLGVVTELPWALVARVLIGAGDAATFISVLRLVVVWFPPRRVPLYTQTTALVGQLGQVAAAVPLVLVLHLAGWTTAFVGLAAVGTLSGILAWATIRDHPLGTVHERSRAGVLAPLREVVREPGTWLGFWTHTLGQFSTTVFVMLWGFPFLISAQGLQPAQASGLLTLNVAAAMAAGPVIGVLTGRHPLRRSWMVLTIAGAMGAAWAAVLLRPGPSPLWLLAVFVVVIAAGGPGASIGFDYARTSNPTPRIGVATGLVNVGGFGAALLSIMGVGVVLDLVSPPGTTDFSLSAFRVAFSVLAIPWVVGVVGVLVTRRSTRRILREHGVVVRPVRVLLAERRAARRGPSRGGRAASGHRDEGPPGPSA
ncbi:MFS transporter [Actinotalea sp. K2]|uniref:MFS transporter n=1 Tax=Actinotalea sp. K2 TaxID=2939438 RepID=UPI00201805BD|nr:MFS transporter [Actinotalea sp. K2]MCL3860139.1 MFS transporter [Actinotalea sp. K2]